MASSVSRSHLALSGLWVVLIGIGMAVMGRYENTPGPVAETPAHWPRTTSLSLSRDRYTAIVFVHPRCSCTQATLAELQVLMTRAQARLQTTVVAVVPANPDRAWTSSSLAQEAATISGVTVQMDRGGLEARRFAALTSGFSVVYDPRGELRFAGGITGARGLAGENPGLAAMEDLVEQNRAGRSKASVFGCELHDPPTRQAKK